MRNPEGGASACTPQFMYKVFFRKRFLNAPFPSFKKRGKGRGNVALNLTIWRMQLHSNRQQPST